MQRWEYGYLYVVNARINAPVPPGGRVRGGQIGAIVEQTGLKLLFARNQDLPPTFSENLKHLNLAGADGWIIDFSDVTRVHLDSRPGWSAEDWMVQCCRERIDPTATVTGFSAWCMRRPLAD